MNADWIENYRIAVRSVAVSRKANESATAVACNCPDTRTNARPNALRL